MSYRPSLILIFCFAGAIFGSHSVLGQDTKSSQADDSNIIRPKMFDVTAMDTTADPCEDFDQYACGTWRKNNPVPSDQVFWARYNQTGEYNRMVLRKILEQAAIPGQGRSETAKIAGDFYASCMDETSVNRAGVSPLEPQLKQIAAISSREGLIDALAWLHAMGVPAMFEFGARPDLHDATREVAVIVQGGLGLPDREYYLSQSEESKRTQARYVAHIAAMLKLLGDAPDLAEKEAGAVLEVEKIMAAASLDRVSMRDPKNHDHKMAVKSLDALAPNLLIARFFKAVGAPAFQDIYVAPPDFFEKLSVAIGSVPLDTWKVYLKWHLAQTNAPFLSEPFVKEDFEFERRFLNGQKEIEPRWKRCVSTADRLLGEALGRLYIEQTFTPETKRRTLEMVKLEEEALAENIGQLPWMTAETRRQALAKLNAVTNKIGYPEKWLNYSSVPIKRNDLAANVRNARSFRWNYNLQKIGHTRDTSEWIVTTPTVNAYYYSPENSINFPAGVFQPPLFDSTMDDAVNFGAIGWLIGHELTHGFDDQGSKFDGQGNLVNWWTLKDREEFDKRTSCIADEYQQFVVVDDIHLNGRLTLGENTADNGGIRIAFAAMHKAAAEKGGDAPPIDGFTSEQRFFISFAQQWCANVTPERLRVIAKIDPHSPVRFRTLGTLGDYSEFAKSFGCKSGQKMSRPNACRVW
jgi:predicted metalloendopeptidase